MRISAVKSLSDPIRLPQEDIQTSIGGRKKELALIIQAALKVGADVAAREAGRRAYAEFVKLDPDLKPASSVPVAPSGQLLFVESKRRRTRPVV